MIFSFRGYTFFTRASKTYMTDGWYDTTIIGQGNKDAPPQWMNHWIANVLVGNDWKLYDPSYGEGPLTSEEPTKATGGGLDFLSLPSYEPVAVKNFRGAIFSSPTSATYPIAIASLPGATNWPRLYGFVLWSNKP